MHSKIGAVCVTAGLFGTFACSPATTSSGDANAQCSPAAAVPTLDMNGLFARMQAEAQPGADPPLTLINFWASW